MVKSNVVLYDRLGNPLDSPASKLIANAPGIKKKALGLYGNIYSYPNYGAFRPRFYTLADSEQGLDALSRELLVRWSREVTAQEPWIGAAIRLIGQYSVGDAYKPVYLGDDSEWGKIAVDWLLEEFYPNCCTRGRAFDFQNVMYLESTMLDQDGDILCLYGRDSNGFPKFQMLPSNRIRSSTMDNSVIEDGPYKGMMVSDGVIYNMMGQAVGYNIINANNLVNDSMDNGDEVKVSARDAQLIYDTRFFDKSRGVPSVGSGILQAITLQELQSYLSEKTKIAATIALTETTPSGEAPYELQQTLEALNAESNSNGTFQPAPNIGGVRMVQGSNIRYLKADAGCDIKGFSANTVEGETANYVKRLEKHVLSALGVPHEILLSPADVSGRMVSGIADIFRSTIERRQGILDKHGKFIIAWALTNAMKNGYIPNKNKENIYKVMGLTHPKRFSLDPAYDRMADLQDYSAGIKSLDDIVSKDNKTAKQVIDARALEAKEFFIQAKAISDSTNTDLNTVIQYLRADLKITIRSNTDSGQQDDTKKSDLNR